MLPQSNLFSGHHSVVHAKAVPDLPVAAFPSNFLSSDLPKTLSEHEPQFRLVEHGRRDRFSAEAYITKQIAKRSAALVGAFTPRLFTLRRSDGSICGAFGLRSARGRLFVEQFIDQPMERCIGRASGSLVERRGIVEVDLLCSSFAAATSSLLSMLFERLRCEEFHWAVMAGSALLREAFEHFGIAPSTVEIANCHRLSFGTRVSTDDGRIELPCVFFAKVEEKFDGHRTDSPLRSRP